MLKKLSLKGVGPAPEMEVEFAERLTVITGDNGLGKSFILDAVWFYFTEKPFSEPITPSNPEEEAIIGINKKDRILPEPHLRYNRETLSWVTEISKEEAKKGLIPLRKTPQRPPIIYIGSDGRIGIYEPSRQPMFPPYASVYYASDLKNGFLPTRNLDLFTPPHSNLPIQGCIYDLMAWEKQKDDKYHQFMNGLKVLSENSQFPLSLVGSKRLTVQDSRDIPMFQTGLDIENDVEAFTRLSSGMQKIILFVYGIVLAWNEHKFITIQRSRKLAKKFIILIDEIETHLHPKWQRKILAAVLEVAKAITEDEDFQVQVICTTHSPIVLTGIEPHFDPEKDKLLDLQLTPGPPGARGTVELREVEFEKLGSVGEWLMSDMFNVDDKPEPNVDALKKRAALFEQEKPTQAEIDEVDRLMRAHFAPDHPERTHWVWLAKQKGLTPRGQQ
jgi:hypothetical protein